MSTDVAAWPESGLEACRACLACGGVARSAWATDLPDRLFECAAGLWNYHRCSGCGSLYIDPRPNRETIADAYRIYYTHDPAITGPSVQAGLLGRFRTALRHGYLNRRFGLALAAPSRLGPLLVPLIPGLARRQRQWARLRRPHAGAALLDVGAGSGAAVAHFSRLGWNASGLDVDPAAVEAAQAAGIGVKVGEVTSLVGEDRFEAITMSHSIEHLHDPAAAVRATFRLLRPGGVLEIGTPNVGAVGSRVYRSDWLGLDAPRHLVLFTRAGLITMLQEAGFRKIRLHGPARPAAWYFEASEALRQRRPWTEGAPLPASARVMLCVSRLCARVLPRYAEELLVTAEKPGSSESPSAGAPNGSPAPRTEDA